MQTTSSRTKMKTINGDSLTPILIFRRLQGKHKFLLESSAQHEGAGRYSFIGANPRKTYKGVGEEIQEVSYKTGKTYVHKGELFVLLKRLMPRISNTTQFPFSGGAVGYIGFGGTTMFVDKKIELPDAHFHVYETIIVFDHQTDEVTLIHTNIDAEKQQPDLEELAQQIVNGQISEEASYRYQPLDATTNESFATVLQTMQANLHDDITRVVLPKRDVANFQGDTLALYRQLRKKKPAAYLYYVEFEDHVVLGTSPESLIRVKGERVIATPTEGACPRGETKNEDLENERQLYNHASIRQSHALLVSAVQQELQSVCFPGSVQVMEAMRIQRSKKALHMTSRIEGKLLPMLHALDVLAATISPSSATEFPHTAGNFGALGFIGFNGHLDFALTGQSIVIKQDIMHMQSTITLTKYTNVENVLQKVQAEEQAFLQLLVNNGGRN
ncbi:chorismate-binding protein [Lysinibacillus fusiformis]|uniref:chorismate-binding protein n=1 Tax=Lysinibacillus fusiformis TaxID=28031 RepID=UPI001967968D|nr:chorismate-binding protein [Lysinibacillus fusiformis]QSB10334.1 chorismate-binding protein [Lysinibacillus fusiformis]